MSKRYYIPIDSVNLSNYYRMAIIAPANYIQNRNRDIQSTFEKRILLSSKIFTTETDCALEIVFDEKEVPEQISDNFYLFDMPLPISRIKRIYFNTEEQKTNTVFNITHGAAFLPQELIKTDSTQTKLDVKEINNYKISKSTKDWKKELESYDKILGGIAIMPISKKEFENYPLNYFGILSLFNKQIEGEIKTQNISPTTNHSWAFIPESKFKQLHELIYEIVDDKVVRDIGIRENVKVQTRNGLFVLDSIPSKTNTYLSAILATYGKDKRKKIDDFLSDFKSNKFEENRLEGIALIFGINNGYSAFRNQYKFGNSRTELKFKLDSKLDFYTIESIYQFVFYSKNNNMVFSYIDNWCPKFKNNNPRSKYYFTILDKHIYLKETKSVSIFERISILLKKWLPLFDTSKIENEIAREVDAIRQQETKNHFFEIQAKNKEIETLKNEIQVLKATSQKVKYNIKETTVSEKKRMGGLFTENNPNLTREEKRADELYSLSLKELKDLAKRLEIKGYSKCNKDDKQKLIDEIIKIEVKQH